MWRYILIAVSLAGAATQMPNLLQQSLSDRSDSPMAQDAKVEAERESLETNPLAGREASIRADANGHFRTRARLNGRSMQILVDTGATLVALNEKTARRIGVRLMPGDFKYRVRTANGETSAALVSIDSIRIGRVAVSDIRASVLRDDSLDTVLLGMSFLRKLKRYEVQSGRLVLEQ